jgi:hypothetical protein
MQPVEKKTPEEARPSASGKTKVAARTRSAGATAVQFSTRTNVLLHTVMTGLCASG